MSPEEFNRLQELADEQVQAIVEGQLILADIHESLEARRFRPFEDDLIMEEHFGERPSEPKVQRVAGVEFVTRVLHRRGAGQSDIKGADLLYEIEDRKYIIIQFKLADSAGNVKADHPQLDTIVANCPLERDPIYRLFGSPPGAIGWCGSWYAVAGPGDTKYLKACEAKRVFGAAKSTHVSAFSNGLSKPTFNELFASCRIGSYVSMPASEVAAFTTWSLNSDRLLFTVLQRGQFV